MALSLSDALSHYRSVADRSHKFWGYFQFAAAGTAGFAWSRKGAEVDMSTFGFLSLAFAVFAVLNLRLVYTSQKEAEVAVKCLQAYAESLEVPSELKPILANIKLDEAKDVATWHGALSVGTLVAVWLRYFLPH